MWMCKDSSTGAAIWRQIDLRLNNMSASSAPGASDDENDGYEEGSLWLDTVAAKIYICKSAAYNAANWQEIGAGGGAGLDNVTITEDDSTYTITDKNAILCDTTPSTGDTGTINVILPPASSKTNEAIHIKNIGTGIVSITTANTGETIDGVVTKNITGQWDSLYMMSNGSDWYLL